jgi:surface antigen
MPRCGRKFEWLVAAGLLLGLAMAAGLWANHRRVGRVLDGYRGVPVYDNGLLFFHSYGRHYGPDGYYYGQKWQCVEYVKRFYHQAKGRKMPDVWGHARDYFDPSLPNGALNPRRGLVQYRNGGTAKPQPDDLLMFTDTKFGHVAIVTEVTANSLEVVQQNILGKPRQRFSLMVSNGCWFVTAPRQPAGWLRLPAGRDPLSSQAGRASTSTRHSD